MTTISNYDRLSRRGRWITFGYVAWKSYEEFTDDDFGLGDVYAAGALVAAGATAIIPEIIPWGIGWGATKAASPAVSAVSRGIANFRAGMAFGSGLGLRSFANKFIWTAGILHIVTMPWQIEDEQQRMEREGVVDSMAMIPLEPGQSPMPIGMLGGPGRFIA